MFHVFMVADIGHLAPRQCDRATVRQSDSADQCDSGQATECDKTGEIATVRQNGRQNAAQKAASATKGCKCDS